MHVCEEEAAAQTSSGGDFGESRAERQEEVEVESEPLHAETVNYPTGGGGCGGGAEYIGSVGVGGSWCEGHGVDTPPPFRLNGHRAMLPSCIPVFSYLDKWAAVGCVGEVNK